MGYFQDSLIYILIYLLKLLTNFGNYKNTNCIMIIIYLRFTFSLSPTYLVPKLVHEPAFMNKFPNPPPPTQ